MRPNASGTSEAFLALADLLPEAMLLLERRGAIVAANRAAAMQLRSTPQALSGRPLAGLAHEPQEAVAEYLRLCARSRQLVLGALTLRSARGEPLAFRCEGAAWSGEGPRLIVLRLIPKPQGTSQFAALNQTVEQLLSEVGRRKGAEQALRQSEARLRQITDHLPALVSYIDREGHYRFCNALYEQWFGLKPADLVGRHMRDVLTGPVYEQRRPYLEACLRGLLVKFEGPTRHRALGPRDCEITYVPDSDVHGAVRGCYVMVVDITERKRAAAALQESEARLRIAVEAARLGTWELDLATRTAVRSLRHDEIFGYSEPLPQWHYEDFLRHVLPEDRDRVDERFRAALATGSNWHFECRIRRQDGQIRWIEAHGQPDAGAERDGKVRRLLGVVADITERKQAEAALRDADRKKDEFLAVLSHELRNPLAPLRTGLELLERGSPTPEAGELVRAMMQRQLLHLMRLVDDLLDVSRISRGKIGLQRKRLDLREVVRAAVELTRPLIVDRAHELEVDLPEEPLPVLGDFQRLMQVVGNLLTNAAKYTEPGGAIRVGLRSLTAEALLSVRDTGLGIPPDRLEEIFEMFAQVPEHHAHFGGGLGVGLGLARELVSMHGGSIEACSGGIGQGSEFLVRLPLGVPAVEPLALERGGDPCRSPAGRVLVVDDNVDAAEALRMLLGAQGHCVQTAHDGPAALEAVRSFGPEVVLLDIGMPRMDGYEVARRIRAMPEGRSIRLLALTGWGQPEDRQRALDAGFDEHLTKPVDPGLLGSLIRIERSVLSAIE